MNQEKEIIIPLNKQKLTLFLLLSLGFVGGSIWFLLNPPTGNNELLHDPSVVKKIGGVCLFAFGVSAVIFIMKLMDKKPGMIINEDGIIDNVSAIAIGKIPWEDIMGIEERKVLIEDLILVMLKDPKAYFDKVGNPVKKQMLTTNFNLYGTPVNFAANSLKISKTELFQLLKEQHKKYKN